MPTQRQPPSRQDDLAAVAGIAVYSRRSRAHGAGEWHAADVTAPARHRLYHARAVEHFALQANDQRIPIQLG
jgi:hypothetical protein